MITISLSADMRGYVRMLDRIRRDMIRKQAPLSINVAARRLRTATINQGAALGGLPKKAIRPRVPMVKRASTRSPTAVVLALTAPLRLAKIPGVKQATSGRVKAPKALRVSGSAFFATMPSGHRGVFVRQRTARSKRVGKFVPGKGRTPHTLPIVELTRDLEYLGRILESEVPETEDVMRDDFELKMQARINKAGYG